MEIGTETAVFSNIKPCQNYDFRLSTDSYGFLVFEMAQL